MQALFVLTISVNLRQQCFRFVSYFGFISSRNWPAAAHSRWEGQYDKCIAGGGGADTGRFLCSASSNCSALLFFISLFFAFTFLTREHKCIVVLLERGVGAYTPHFLLFAQHPCLYSSKSMLIPVLFHSFTLTCAILLDNPL